MLPIFCMPKHIEKLLGHLGDSPIAMRHFSAGLPILSRNLLIKGDMGQR